MFQIVVLLAVVIPLTDSASSHMRIPDFAGPIRVVLKQIGECPKEMLGANLHSLHAVVKQTRGKDGVRLYGYLESKAPMDDSVEALLKIASWSSNGGWANNAFVFPRVKFCSATKAYFAEFFAKMEQNAVPTGIKFCPRGASNFTVEGGPTTFVPGKIVTFPYGKYRADFTFYTDEKLVGCTRFFGESVPLLDRSKRYNGTQVLG